MNDSVITSTPSNQTDPPEAGPHHSILRGLRERRDHRGRGRTAAGRSEDDNATRLSSPGTSTNRKSLSIDPNRNPHPDHRNDTTTTNAGLDRPRKNSQVSMTRGGEPEPEPREKSGQLILYRDLAIAFAVDISWSTHSEILHQEKKAVKNLAKHLSPTARKRARVLPWNSIAHLPIKLSSIDELRSSGGTDPTVLNTDRNYHDVLRDCSLWFLLTDGEIDQAKVKSFALGVDEKGLHGKACVIILFDHRPSRPISCNISVGQAVFAVAPDCAFLFHDADTGEVFVFQCKGCFRELLPLEKMQIVIDATTSWDELPQTSYDKLAELAVPKLRQVGRNTVLLGSGRIINLEDLYSNRLSTIIAAEILDNDDDLKSVLLTAQNRGKSREIEDWISKQRMSRQTTEYFDRPDVHDMASELVNKLVTAMRAGGRDLNLERTIRRNLREAHLRNWTTFINSISSAKIQMVQRNTVVDDALARVRLNRDSPGSPAMMSPVSPRPSADSRPSSSSLYPTAQSSLPYHSPPLPRLSPAQLPPRSSWDTSQFPASPGSPAMMTPVSPRRSDHSRTSSSSLSPTAQSFLPYHPPPLSRFSPAQLPQRSSWDTSQFPASAGAYPAYGLPSQYQGRNDRRYMNHPMPHPVINPYSTAPQRYPPSPFPGNAELSQLLYMKGYKLGSGPAAAQPFSGHCELCEEDSSPLALLLKAAPADCETEGGFPTPSSHAEIKFPLAMGNFLETDIISSFLCCEKCACFIRHLGISPVDDRITGVIPLVPLSNEMNRDSALKEIDAALEERFNVAILDQTFLSILYSKLDHVTAENLPGSDLLISALRWECQNFISQISLPTSLSTSFDPNEDTTYTPLSSTMSVILPTIDTSGANNLVHYPVEGFVTILKGTLDLGLMSPSDDLVKKAVFQRFLFHLAEQQSMLREEIGTDAATEELRGVLTGEIGGLCNDRFCAEVEALEGTYLLESDAWESFRRLKDVFRYIERDCGIAIRLFLQLMMDLPWKDGPAEELFNMAKSEYGNSMLFIAPWDLQEADCKEVLRQLT